MPSPVNLNPTDMSDLTALMPITFSYQGASGAAFVFVWIQYKGSDDKIMVYDGVSFHDPFIANSEVFRPKDDDTLINFKIVPELGWAATVAELRTEAFFVA